MSNLPNGLLLRTYHRKPIPPLELAKAYANIFRSTGCGEVQRYKVADGKGERAGGFAQLEAELRRLGPETHYFWMRTRDGTDVSGARGDPEGVWDVMVNAPEPPTQAWLSAMGRGARALTELPAFDRLYLGRSSSGSEFMPEPPIARMNHLVTTTDAEVAAAYDDPSVFWAAWNTVDRIGELRLCARAMSSLSEEDWLESTLLSTMELARHARPKLTKYRDCVWLDWTRPWWEFGDIQEERAGFPALTLVGYDPDTRTVQFDGFVTRRPLVEGGEEPRHVLIAEIHPIRSLVLAGETDDGRPIDTVRIVFPHEWMARQERRPLLDVGARVFYLNPADGELVEVTD